MLSRCFLCMGLPNDCVLYSDSWCCLANNSPVTHSPLIPIQESCSLWSDQLDLISADATTICQSSVNKSVSLNCLVPDVFSMFPGNAILFTFRILFAATKGRCLAGLGLKACKSFALSTHLFYL